MQYFEYILNTIPDVQKKYIQTYIQNTHTYIHTHSCTCMYIAIVIMSNNQMCDKYLRAIYTSRDVYKFVEFKACSAWIDKTRMQSPVIIDDKKCNVKFMYACT